MAASNRASRTLLVEAQTGLRIYVLDFLADLQQWVVGPDGADPRTLDPDNLPEGFSYVCPDHTNVREDEAKIVFYSQNEHWRESPYIGGLIDSALVAAGATGEEACDIDTADFDRLLADLQCDVINFLGDRGYPTRFFIGRQRNGVGVVLHNCAPEHQTIVAKAFEAAVAASKPAYEESAASLVQGLRAREQEKQDAKRLALFDEAVDLLERSQPNAIRVYRLEDDIKDFLAKVAKK